VPNGERHFARVLDRRIGTITSSDLRAATRHLFHRRGDAERPVDGPTATVPLP